MKDYISDQELGEKALFAALESPQELVCVDFLAAKRVRFALYGLRRTLGMEHPKLLSLILKVQENVVHISLPKKKILSFGASGK